MSFAPKRCHGSLNQGTKKGLLAADPLGTNPVSILPRTSSKDALRQLQNKRFRQESKRHERLDDWLIWLFPKPEPWVHRVVDRLLTGDVKTAQRISSLRQEMGL